MLLLSLRVILQEHTFKFLRPCVLSNTITVFINLFVEQTQPYVTFLKSTICGKVCVCVCVPNWTLPFYSLQIRAAMIW